MSIKITDEMVEAALWAWIVNATEGVPREHVSQRVLDLNWHRAEATIAAVLPLIERAVRNQVVQQAADMIAECERAESRLTAVRALHAPREEQAITGDCAEEECNHEDWCPTIQYEVCAECYRVAEESDRYFGEYSLDYVAYPCPTIRALDGAS